jgi:sodium-dependent dicarboxylate transporter 2/3/5
MTKAKFIKFIIASVLAIAALFLPYESMPQAPWES